MDQFKPCALGLLGKVVQTMFISSLALKTGLVFFWALWLSIVFLTNLFAGLKHLSLLPPGWKFASENDQMIQKAVAVYNPPAWLADLLFLGVVIWEGAAAAFLWNALRLMLDTGLAGLPAVDTAFAVLLGLWAALMIANEVFLDYPNQATQLMIFIAQLATLVAIHFI
jgi:hypothetical protein